MFRIPFVTSTLILLMGLPMFNPVLAQFTGDDGDEIRLKIYSFCMSKFNTIDFDNPEEEIEGPIRIKVDDKVGYIPMNIKECIFYHFGHSRGQLVQECINENEYSKATQEEKFDHCQDWFEKKYNSP